MKNIALQAFSKHSKDIYRFDGWALCEEYKPPKFDIVVIKDVNGRQQRGWWTGYCWDFGKKRIAEPQYWRRELEYLVDR